MNKNRSNIFSVARRTLFVFVLLTTVFAGFLLLTEQAAVKSNAATDSNTARQPNYLGRLAFDRMNFFTSGASGTSVISVNADGTDETTLAPSNIPVYNTEPAWSPNGAKIAYTIVNPDGIREIYSMDAGGGNKVRLTDASASRSNPSWSATNKIAYQYNDIEIWTMNADGSEQMKFTAITQPSPIMPAWSPDGSKLAFVSGNEIWVINANGTGEQRVTLNQSADADPAWSGDGTKIVFGKGGFGIAVVNLDGTNETNLTTNALDGKPSWSNDGTRIAFVRNDIATGGIFTMDANGANQLKVVANQSSQPGRNSNDNPAWQPTVVTPNTAVISGRLTLIGASLSNRTVNLFGSANATTTTDALGYYHFSNLPPGGNYTVVPRAAGVIFTPNRRVFNNITANQIADFSGLTVCATTNCTANGKIAYIGNDSNLYTTNSDGTNRVMLTNVQRDDEPVWSPDGVKIVFQSRRDILTAPEIYAINGDGTSLVRLTNNTFEDSYPSFSPDGTKILFVSNRDGDREIYQMNADGTNQVRLTNNATEDNYPKYSPDGTKIVFMRVVGNSGNLHTMNADGSNVVQITAPAPVLRDITPSYSPDGTKIVFARYNQGPFTSEFYTINPDGTGQSLIWAAAFHYKPSYSPDGTRILYTRFTGGTNYEVRGIIVGGSNDQFLFTGGTRADWQPIRAATRPAQFDFDADGKTDLTVFRPSNGLWYRTNSGDNSFFAAQFGIASDRIAPADYDGDGKTDLAVWREGTSAFFYILNSATNTFRAQQFGTTGDVPTAGDWDGDGQADLSVYRRGAVVNSPSTFYYLPSGTPSVNLRFITSSSGGKPIVADFDGDGRIDAAHVTTANVWRITRSSDNLQVEVTYGLQTDIPVAADYDGDGRADVGVFRPSTGIWYAQLSNIGTLNVQFGTDGDLPVPADYDGDGKADVAVFRPSNGLWYLLRSRSGFGAAQFGTSGDKPAPNAFIY